MSGAVFVHSYPSKLRTVETFLTILLRSSDGNQMYRSKNLEPVHAGPHIQESRESSKQCKGLMRCFTELPVQIGSEGKMLSGFIEV